MLPKAILLDMDDTIIALNHDIDLDACWKKVCSKHLVDIEETRINELVISIQETAKWYWSDADRHRIGRLDLYKARVEIIKAAFQQFDLQDSSLPHRIALNYGLERDNLITLFPGAIETLIYISKLGIKTALITNGGSQAQRHKIDRFGLSSHFEHILIEEEFGAGKPDHSIYLHAIKQLGVKPEETWMVGDNYEWEVIAPQELGIKGIWINHNGIETDSVQTKPFRTVRALNEIVHLLK